MLIKNFYIEIEDITAAWTKELIPKSRIFGKYLGFFKLNAQIDKLFSMNQKSFFSI